MNRDRVLAEVHQTNYLFRWLGIVFLLLLLSGVSYMSYPLRCIDGCGPYHHTTNVADLDGDGDLDALVGTKAGAVIRTNQRGAQGGQTGFFVDSG